jgi:pyruvate/2-oxoglutarate dehydrogenase complex dihydrolipoamide acyltransferase (E2) component
MLAVRIPAETWGDAEGDGLLEHWLVKEGARVIRGQPLAEAIIVKSNIEVTAPADGTLVRILVPDQGTFGPGQDLALLTGDIPS